MSYDKTAKNLLLGDGCRNCGHLNPYDWPDIWCRYSHKEPIPPSCINFKKSPHFIPPGEMKDFTQAMRAKQLLLNRTCEECIFCSSLNMGEIRYFCTVDGSGDFIDDINMPCNRWTDEY